MSYGIQFLLSSLLFCPFASANSELDKCFEKEALPYLTSACEQVLKLVKTDEKYNCKNVVDARSLVLLGERTDVAGNVKVPAPAAALTSYTSYYKSKVEPYYKAKCLPNQTAATASNNALASNLQNSASSTGAQSSNPVKKFEDLNKKLAKLEEKPKDESKAQDAKPDAKEVESVAKPTASTLITDSEIKMIKNATNSSAPVSIIDVKKDASGNEISRTYIQDGQTFTTSTAGGAIQIQSVKPNSALGIAMTGDASSEGRVTLDISKINDGKVIDQGQVTIAVNEQGRYIATGDVCKKGTPDSCQERARESVDVTDQLQANISLATKAAASDSPCNTGNWCNFEPLYDNKSIVGDVATTVVNSAPAPLSITDEVIHTCASNPKAAGCAGETYATKDGLVVSFSQEGKTLFSGTAEQLATAEGFGFSKKNAILVEKENDGTISTRIFDANGEHHSTWGGVADDGTYPVSFVAAANLPRAVSNPSASSSAAVSETQTEGATARAVTQPQDTNSSLNSNSVYTYDEFGNTVDRRTGQVVKETPSVATEVVSNATSRTVINGRTHCTDDTDEQCQQISANENSTGMGQSQMNGLTSGTNSTGDAADDSSAGGGLSLAEIARTVLPLNADKAIAEQQANLANLVATSGTISNSEMDFFKSLEGKGNEKAIAALKAATETLNAAGQMVSPQVNVASQMQQAVNTYKEASNKCGDYEKMASTACIAESNPTLKKTIEASQMVLPVIQAATGMNDACSKISKALGTVNKGILIASAVCGGFQAICSIGCAKTASTFYKITEVLPQAMNQIAQASSRELTACFSRAERQGEMAPVPPQVFCAKEIAKNSEVAKLLAQVGNSTKIAVASETNAKDPNALVGKIAKCGAFLDTLKKTTASILSLAQSNMQARQCAAQTAANSSANKCQDSANEGSLECLCQRAEFKNTQSCRQYATGCAVAGQMKNAAGVCVAQAEACLDPVNANKSECLTVTAGQCALAENAGRAECVCLVNPAASGCPGGTKSTIASSTAGSTGASGLVPQASTTNSNSTTVVSGAGLQKMSGDRTSEVANLNGASTANSMGKVGLGSDGASSGGAMKNPTAYGSAGGTGAAGSGVGGTGGLGDNGREPASEANGKGKTLGYKGASAESVGGGYGGGSFGGLNWDREKSKNDALKKLNDVQEKNKLAGATILKSNGVTGATGKTLWEKVSTRYRENKSTLMVDDSKWGDK